MYYEFESRQNMKTLIFDDDCLTVGDSVYPYEQIESLKITPAQLFATYGLLTVRYLGKDITIPFPRSYSSKIKRAIREMEREKDNREKQRSVHKTGRVLADDGRAPESAALDPYEEMKKLKELLDLDIISEEEFAKKKKELLGL